VSKSLIFNDESVNLLRFTVRTSYHLDEMMASALY